MASIKVFSLLIKTLSKPIANRIKISAQEHPKFRNVCVEIAQSLHRYETRLAAGIFSNSQPVIRPLSDTKAIQNGANFLSEAFLFSVAVALIVAENLRGRIQTAHRRDAVDDRLTELESFCANIRSEQMALEEKLWPLILWHDEAQVPSQPPEPLTLRLRSQPSKMKELDNEPSTGVNDEGTMSPKAKLASGPRLV